MSRLEIVDLLTKTILEKPQCDKESFGASFDDCLARVKNRVEHCKGIIVMGMGEVLAEKQQKLAIIRAVNCTLASKNGLEYKIDKAFEESQLNYKSNTITSYYVPGGGSISREKWYEICEMTSYLEYKEEKDGKRCILSIGARTYPLEHVDGVIRFTVLHEDSPKLIVLLSMLGGYITNNIDNRKIVNLSESQLPKKIVN